MLKQRHERLQFPQVGIESHPHARPRPAISRRGATAGARSNRSPARNRLMSRGPLRDSEGRRGRRMGLPQPGRVSASHLLGVRWDFFPLYSVSFTLRVFVCLIPFF